MGVRVLKTAKLAAAYAEAGYFFAHCEVTRLQLKATIMDENAVKRAMMRISHEITEVNKGSENIVIVGIKRRGIPLGKLVCENIKKIEGVDVPFASVDITFYRDDLEKAHEDPEVKNADLGVDINEKTVVLVDDVLYTGRTARAAIDAVFSAGRPSRIQLAILVDRGHRELPVRADFVGKSVPTSKNEVISVKVPEYDGSLCAELYSL